MALVPNGKRRMMVAQVSPGPEHEGTGLDMPGVESGNVQFQENKPAINPAEQQDPSSEMGGDPAAPVDPAQQEGAPAVEDPAAGVQSDMAEQQGQQQKSGQEGDVRKSVFDFLVTLGYPPRRLMEFKSQFVQETGSATTGTQVTLVIPDEVYAKNIQIPREKLKELVQIVESQHGLSFQDYKRANEQLTLNFLTVDAAAQNSLDQAGPGDILDKVYGKPAGKGGAKGKGAKAMTIQEMIKISKDQQIETLKKVLGSKI